MSSRRVASISIVLPTTNLDKEKHALICATINHLSDNQSIVDGSRKLCSLQHRVDVGWSETDTLIQLEANSRLTTGVQYTITASEHHHTATIAFLGRCALHAAGQ